MNLRQTLMVAIVSITFESIAYNWQLDNLNWNLNNIEWQLRDQNNALDNAAFHAQRAAEEFQWLREAEERSAAIAIATERQRRKEAEEQWQREVEERAAIAEAAKQIEQERLTQEQVRTQIEAMRLAEQREHNANMAQMKAIELSLKMKEQEARDAFRCEWTENGIRCPAMKIHDGSYCATHAQKVARRINYFLAEMKQKNDAIDRRFREQPPCKARCGRRALPNHEWCAIHLPGAKNPYEGMTAEQERERRISITKQVMANIERQIMRYRRATKGGLPQSLRELQIQMGVGAVSHLKDEWGENIYYETDGSAYAMQSAGPDKKFETADDITIIRSESEIKNKSQECAEGAEGR